MNEPFISFTVTEDNMHLLIKLIKKYMKLTTLLHSLHFATYMLTWQKQHLYFILYFAPIITFFCFACKFNVSLKLIFCLGDIYSNNTHFSTTIGLTLSYANYFLHLY